jgi:Uma2 family endonuclease
VLFEVVSPGSGKRDFGIKRELYLSLPTVRNYVVIAVKTMEVTAFDRGGGEPRRLADLALPLDLPGLGVAIPLASIYRRTPRALDALP